MCEMLKVTSTDLAGVYKELAEQIGLQSTYVLYQYFKGQQITFPLKFYSNEYIAENVWKDHEEGMGIRKIAKKYEYSESRIRQILRGKAGDKKAKL